MRYFLILTLQFDALPLGKKVHEFFYATISMTDVSTLQLCRTNEESKLSIVSC